MRQLTSLDAQFLAIETPRTFGHVGGFAVYDPSTAPGGTLTVDDIRELVAERLHLLPPFHWRLVSVPLSLDNPYWIEDAHFDLDFHIRDSAVPPPGDDRQIAETIARIFARPLDRSRPLWELYVINGLPDGKIGLHTKVHHSVVDGVSGAEILSILLDQSPDGREIPPPERERATEREPSDLEMLARGLAGMPLFGLRALRSIPRTLPNLPDIPGTYAIPGGPTISRVISKLRRDPRVLEETTARAPRTCFNGPISAHRRFAFGSLSLETVKRIKNEAGVTVNDVVVSLCAGAVREWLDERGELPPDPLVAMVPVSVRTEEQKGTFGNRVSMMIVPIPTNEAEPRERLARAHENLMGAKQRHSAVPADLLTDATAFIPPAVAARAARTAVSVLSRTRPPLNLVISNVPGPREPLYCAGAQLEANYPVSAIFDGVGLNITVMSYMDHMDVGIVADRDQMDDIWSLLGGMQRALDELETVVCGKPAPKPRKRAAAAKVSR